MHETNSKARWSRRPNLLTAAATAIYFMLLALGLYELDRQHYMNQKYEIIRNRFAEIFNLPWNLSEEARAALYTAAPQARTRAMKRLSTQLEEIVRGPTSIYRFELLDPSGQKVLDIYDQTKPRRYNTWKNNLFLRDFQRFSDLRLTPPDAREGDNPPVGHLIAHFTSPINYAPIEQLTQRYRRIALILFLVGLTGYYFLYKYLLLPMRRVSDHLEQSKFETPTLIPRASAVLESSYNSLAAMAILQQIQEKLGQLLQTNGAKDREKIIYEALDLVRLSFGLKWLELAELTGEAGRFSVFEHLAAPAGHLTPSTDICVRADSSIEIKQENPQPFGFTKEGDFNYIDETGGITILIFGLMRLDLPDLGYRIECTRRACETIRGALISFHAQEQDIVRQRSEANIVLSRNLGHDLTNIIATTKLDLMAVRQLLDSADGKPDGPRGELLRESVAGVLESTKFLQEIVNLYRSFSYIKRPQFERHDLNEVVEQFLSSFEPSISSRIRVMREFQQGMPSLILEPRLIKLALFNVLSNALEAIKRDSASQRSPLIIVRTKFHPEDAVFTIEVEDSGPGIRDESGRLLSRSEIDSIFQYGYSTKSESSEGLGLNWVRTIIEDFHQGSVTAENVDSSGARLTLNIKSMEIAEARIGD